jgi:uncharacterized protein YndB with AHSA1/START domain
VSIVRGIDVPVAPDEAFRMFTEEIDDWYERGPHSWNDPERAVAIRFDGGRLLEVYREGEPYEIGRVTLWEPGRRLAFAYRSVHLPPEPETEVEVRFEPVAGGTRVTLEHRGLDRMPPEVYALWQQRAWIRLMQVFADYVTS